jgi:hypothetical protein
MDPGFLARLLQARDNGVFGPKLLKEINSALGRHFWNTALCAALYPAIHSAEILYRNVFDTAFRKQVGSDKWLIDLTKTSIPTWPAFNAKKLKEHFDRRIDLAKERASKKYDGDEPDGSPSQSQILAELDLGFWIDLTEEITATDWNKIRDDIFPHPPFCTAGKKEALVLLKSLGVVRNSVAHAHPLWAGADESPPRNKCRSEGNNQLNYMKSRHSDVYDLITSINPDIAAILSSRDDFTELLHANPKNFFSWSTLVSVGS